MVLMSGECVHNTLFKYAKLSTNKFLKFPGIIFLSLKNFEIKIKMPRSYEAANIAGTLEVLNSASTKSQ